MVESIIGNYLIEKGLLTKEQLKDIRLEQQKARAKLGLIAIAEGLMTQEETERVNRLQSIMDKRFGDIAIEKKYLTKGQVEALLKKQGNAYLSFAQVLEDQQLMTIEQLEQYLVDFKCEKRMGDFAIVDLKSDDVDRILPFYLPEGCEQYLNVAGVAIRTLIRCVDTEVYPEPAYLTTELMADNGAVQYVEGEHDVACCIAGKENDLLQTASIFGREDFSQVDEDALDAIGELLNCINGLYASALSQSGISTELLPPEYSAKLTKITCKKMLVIPLHIKESSLNFVIAIDEKVEMK